MRKRKLNDKQKAKHERVLRAMRSETFEVFLDIRAELMSGWNYAWVAEESGVNIQTLYNWDNLLVYSPHLRTLHAVAKALGYKIALVKIQELKKVA